jgi:sulfatase modifying factor 1
MYFRTHTALLYSFSLSFYLITACSPKASDKEVTHCFAPGRSGMPQIDTMLLHIPLRTDTSHAGMVQIPAGEFEMGAKEGEGFPEEHPQHKVKVNGFWMDAHEVTNDEFAAFVKATGYITLAEQKPDWEVMKLQVPPGTLKPPDSLLVAGSMVFSPPDHPVPLDDPMQWWRFVPGADWRHPEGKGSTIEGKGHYPVVHVSWEDAMAYCKWSGKRLPTEAEWEWAAKGGIRDAKYSWGNEELKDGFYPANIWQGEFPNKNTASDGYITTAPVQSFAANGFGLYDMSGNVWEWVSDWMDANYYSTLGPLSVNPAGPAEGGNTTHPYQKVLKGGSFLCHASYCTGYRVARRSSNGWDSGSNHIGFRCVKS